MILPYEKGLSRSSELYEYTPSARAERVFYYLQRGGHYICNAKYRVERESYPSYFLACVLKGMMRISCMEHSSIISAGEIGFIDCHLPHSYAAEGELDFLWLHFDGANTGQFFREFLRSGSIVMKPGSPDPVINRVRVLLKLISEPDLIEEADVSARIHTLLCVVLRNHFPDSARDPVISAARKYFRDHLDEKIPLSETASEFGMSVSSFTRLFRQYTGQTPHEYLVNQRINRAKELLRETNLSVTEIALMTGYEYSTSFESAFRRKTGMTPRTFRHTSV